MMLSISSKGHPYLGVGGGPFFYAGEPINSDLSDNKLVEKIDELSPVEPVKIERIVVNDKKSIKFKSLKGYSNYIGVETVLVPFKKNGFVNMMVSGPDLAQTKQGDTTKTVADEINKYMTSGDYKKDEKINKRGQLFNLFITSIKF